MKTSDFHYDLPEHLIAQQPGEQRTDSRLLHYSRSTRSIEHTRFNQFLDLLNPGDCLVFNDTRVVPARLYGYKETGGKVEILIERLVDEYHALAHVRASKTPKPGTRIELSTKDEAVNYDLYVDGRQGELFALSSKHHSFPEMMQQVGHMPLPPYISRTDTDLDAERYQTVYADNPGAVAAPTAGLHFDKKLLEDIEKKGVSKACVTLHVGAGTFQPVRTERIEQHVMHTESLSVPLQTVEACKAARETGNRVIAVGTTAVRSLETASQNGSLAPYEGETGIFIYPGYRFRSVDAMLTNFHLPESTLLMLISAFAGMDEIRLCYQQAIEHEYRFFSYGDAMFIS